MSKRLQKVANAEAVRLSFLLGAATAVALFLPFLFVDGGFFLYCGDYNEQQIPFYLYANHFIKTAGGGTWSWATDLGTSFVNSYSFYNLGSPFLWLSLWIPSRWMPFAMVPLFVVKFGVMAAAAALYFSRYAKSLNMTVIASLVYAFCGFNVYNIFFNHMLEPALIFPLMLWALDEFVLEGRRGAFAFFVGLALLNSYFFFLGNVTFIVLYFLVKLACGEYRITLRGFGLLAFEAVLGVGLGMVLALPSFFNLIENPRIDNFANGMGLLMFGRVQQYFAVLTSLFLPPDPPYLPNLFPDAVIKWTSMSFYLPLVGMAGVFAYTKSRKGGSVKILLFTSLLCALVPILNSAFYAFNASYYARWYYMPLLMAALATLHSLEEEDIDLEGGICLTAIFTAVTVVFGLVPAKDGEEWTLGVADEPVRFWLSWGTAMLAVALFWVIVHFFRDKKRFFALLLGAVMGFSVFYSIIHISLGKFRQWERDSEYKTMQWEGSAAIDLPDDGFYRIDTYEAHDNLGLWLDRSSIRTFNSVVTPSIMEFYPMVGVKRDVSSKPELENYALRGLLGVRFTLMPADKEEAFLGQPGVAGWRRYAEQGPYVIYENENYVPMGFTYDEYFHMASLESIRVEDRPAVLMRGIGLDSQQIGQYRSYFMGEAITMHREGLPENESKWYQYGPVYMERYVQDCAERREECSYSFTADAKGFVSKIRMERDNLVFFGVPYDPGFSATVNGRPAEVLKVSGGMMAVPAPAGDNEIVFTYRTPGLFAGALISVGSLLALAGYVMLCRHKSRCDKSGAGCYNEWEPEPESEQEQEPVSADEI